MKTLAGAVGAAIVGAALGWFLPALVWSRPHEFEALGVLVLQVFCAGLGAVVGLIVGGGVAAKYWASTGQGFSSPSQDPSDR
jgi:hypothetical protein